MEKEVNISLVIDGVDKNIKSLDDLKEVVKDLTGETKDLNKETKKTADDSETAFGRLKSAFGDATNGIRGVVSGMKTLKGALLTSGVGAFVLLLGSVVSYFKNSEEGSKKFRIALEALNIFFEKLMDLIVPLGEDLIGLFENPKQALKDFGNLLVSQITNRIVGIAKLIPELSKAFVKLFEGDLEGAAKTAVDAVAVVATGINNITDVVADAAVGVKEFVNDVANAVTDSIDAATKLINAQDNLQKTSNRLKVENAELNKELQKQIKIAEDTTLSYEERKNALQEIDAIQIKQAENITKQAGIEENLLRLQIQNTSNVEERKELENQLADAVTNRINAETELEQVRLDAGKTSRELELEELDRKRNIAAIIAKIDIETTDNKLKQLIKQLDEEEKAQLAELENLKSTEEEKQAIREFYNEKRKEAEIQNAKDIQNILDGFIKQEEENQFRKQEIDLENDFNNRLKLLNQAGATEEDILQLRASYAEKLNKIKEDQVNYEKQLEKEKTLNTLDLTAGVLNGVSALVGENTAAGKAAALATATIDTYVGAQKAYTSQLVPGDPTSVVRAVLAAAAAVATGLANVKKIVAVKTPGGGSAGSTGSIVNNAVPFDPTASLRNEQEINRVVTLEQRGTATAVKAYVVSSDMTKQQEIDSKIKNLSRL